MMEVGIEVNWEGNVNEEGKIVLHSISSIPSNELSRAKSPVYFLLRLTHKGQVKRTVGNEDTEQQENKPDNEIIILPFFND